MGIFICGQQPEDEVGVEMGRFRRRRSHSVLVSFSLRGRRKGLGGGGLRFFPWNFGSCESGLLSRTFVGGNTMAFWGTFDI